MTTRRVQHQSTQLSTSVDQGLVKLQIGETTAWVTVDQALVFAGQVERAAQRVLEEQVAVIPEQLTYRPEIGPISGFKDVSGRLTKS